jgi:hypothetical protein
MPVSKPNNDKANSARLPASKTRIRTKYASKTFILISPLEWFTQSF